MCWRARVLAALVTATVMGCVSIEVPLSPDGDYLQDWGPIASLGAECKVIEGRYLNEGTLAGAGKLPRPGTITSMLETLGSGRTVSLSIRPQGVDRERGALVAVRIVLDDNASAVRERAGCSCVSETLVCAPIDSAPGKLPTPGVGVARNNVLMSVAKDGSLIAKIQGFQVSTILGNPVFDITRTWARFERSR